MTLRSRTLLAGLALFSAAALCEAQAGGPAVAGIGASFAARAAAENAETMATGGELSSSAFDAGPHSPDTDARLARADQHFKAGRQAYFQGNLDAARREFDAAVEALLNAPDAAPDHRRIERRLDEICDLVYRFDVEKLGAGADEDDQVEFEKAPIDEISHMTFPVDKALAPKLQSELNQTASGIPLELSDPVLSYVKFFSSDRGRSILTAGFRRSGRYRDLIQRVFAEEGVPQELIYLAQAESGFLPRAVSVKSAVGMWQFMAGTGALYNLTRTNDYDDRLDPEKATRAAARHLKDLYQHFGDWYLAMAAYDCGAGAVDRAVERTGYADYWELLKRHALPKETASYVPIIVAMTIIAKNPSDYGLDNIDLDPPVQFDTIHVTAPTNLNLVADASMQPVSVIRDLNPSLLRNLAPAGFDVHVPTGAGENTQASIESVPAPNRQAWRLHHVEAGDTLSAIARTYHLTAERIVAVNRGADSLETGDVLLIPAVYHDEAQHLRRTAVSTRRTAGRSHGLAASSRTSRVAAAHHVPMQALHRKAAVRTAGIER